MAIAPLTAATKPIKSIGLFDASGGKTFEDWQKNAAPGDAMPSIAPGQINDSMADMVTKITAKDSPLMRAAQTEGLKVANRRGLLNSSFAAGATQRAMLDAALPIASQDASTAANKNAAARAFEYGMAAQDDQQAFASAEAGKDRGLQRELSLAQIASTEGIAAAQRQLDLTMQDNAIRAADQQQIRDIASREGIAAAERELQLKIQQREIEYQTAQRQLDRTLQEKLASWNLSSSDRNAAAQMLVNMEQLYASQYQSIMANTALSAEQRTAQLASIRALRDRQLNFVEQMYDIDLEWGQSIGSSGGGSVAGSGTTTPNATTPAAVPSISASQQATIMAELNRARAEAKTVLAGASITPAQRAAISAQLEQAESTAKTVLGGTSLNVGPLWTYLDPMFSGLSR